MTSLTMMPSSVTRKEARKTVRRYMCSRLQALIGCWCSEVRNSAPVCISRHLERYGAQ